ncbi:MAG: HAD-IIIC family phosphatase [Alphaproteobacteria bacterium]|nr:HAD-IIIC family phosphatase [Alphaproteobacteria bacterium]
MDGSPAAQPIKCLVWDLDNTLWDGVLLEGPVSLRADSAELIRILDGHGVLHAIASQGDYAAAWEQLTVFGLADYFLCPHIDWTAKSNSLAEISQSLNLGLDTFAFVDDQAYERAEVSHAHPEVLCVDARQDLLNLLDHPRLRPGPQTPERGRRRHMYQQDFKRRAAEELFDGPATEFQASLGMELSIFPAQTEDLGRVEELVARTSQLNSTGYDYTLDELDAFRQSSDHLMLVAELNDRFGWYGKVGLVVVEVGESVWTLKLLVVSCRVMSRGVGVTLLSEIMRRARDAGARLQAEFRHTGRNRIMMVTYRFAGFREVFRDDDHVLLEHDLEKNVAMPAHIEVIDTGRDRLTAP